MSRPFHPVYDRIIRFVAKPLLGLVLCCLLFFAAQALVSFIYTIDEPQPFGGSQLYNPYTAVYGGNDCLKMNLHAHSHHWIGLTNGVGTPDEVAALYAEMGYDVIGISNYQAITETELPAPKIALPVYEHGYGVNKFHQLVINPQRVSWQDQLYYLNTSQKLYMYAVLQDSASLLCFNHPAFTRNLSPDEMKFIKGYDLMEAASGMAASSMKHWDAALSAGIPSFILANDDSHNIKRLDEYGRFCTLVYPSDRSREGVLAALRMGRTVGVMLPSVKGEPLSTKAQHLSELPALQLFALEGDSLHVVFDRPMKDLRFIGQNGLLKADFGEVSEAKVSFGDHDTYLRMEAESPEGAVLYFNPVFRYEQIDNLTAPLKSFHSKSLKVDTGYTALYRSASVLLIVALYFMLRRLWKW